MVEIKPSRKTSLNLKHSESNGLKDFLKESDKKISDQNINIPEKEGNFYPAYPVEFLEVFSYSDVGKQPQALPESSKKEDTAFLSYALVIEGDSIHKIFASKIVASEFLEIIPYCR